MVSVATWADEVRPQRLETARWHYVNIPLDVQGFDAKRDCARSDCVVGAIERFQRGLADLSLLPAEALKFLIRFVGDAHQPLHCSDNGNWGGNKTKFRVGGKTANLRDVDALRLSARPCAVGRKKLEDWRRDSNEVRPHSWFPPNRLDRFC